jgi:ABC-type uncharacterized transport system ATPase subunit
MNKETGTTIIFSTHILEEAERYSTHMLLTDSGESYAQGTTDKVKQIISNKKFKIQFSGVVHSNSVKSLETFINRQIGIKNAQINGRSCLFETEGRAKDIIPNITDKLNTHHIPYVSIGPLESSIEDLFYKMESPERIKI